jgi:hypothetical protein
VDPTRQLLPRIWSGAIWFVNMRKRWLQQYLGLDWAKSKSNRIDINRVGLGLCWIFHVCHAHKSQLFFYLTSQRVGQREGGPEEYGKAVALTAVDAPAGTGRRRNDERCSLRRRCGRSPAAGAGDQGRQRQVGARPAAGRRLTELLPLPRISSGSARGPEDLARERRETEGFARAPT